MAQTKREIQLGDKYQDRKNDKRIGEVVEINDKTKTVTLQFEDGKQRPYSRSMLPKSFRFMNDSDVAGDGTPLDLEEVGKEIAEEAKKKAEEHKKLNESAKKTSEIINKAEAKEEKKEAEKKVKKAEKTEKKKEKKPVEPEQKKERKSTNEVALAYTERAKKVAESMGFTTRTYSGMPTDLAVREDKKRLFEIYFSKSRVKVYTSADRVPKGVDYKEVKSSFNASVTLEYPADDKKFETFVKDILNW